MRRNRQSPLVNFVGGVGFLAIGCALTAQHEYFGAVVVTLVGLMVTLQAVRKLRGQG